MGSIVRRFVRDTLRAASPSASASLAILVVGSLAASPAWAQPSEDDPQFMIVETDNVPLRSGEYSFMYPVAYLEQGQILEAVGEVDDSFIVRYPEDVPGLVEANEVERVPERGVVRLLNASRLLARDVSRAAPQSWKSLLDRPLPAGTELSVIRSIENASGRTTSFLVEAPDGARGFVDAQFVRNATDAEVRRFRTSQEQQREARAPHQQADSATEGQATSEGQAMAAGDADSSRPDEDREQVARADEQAPEADESASEDNDRPIDSVAANNARQPGEGRMEGREGQAPSPPAGRRTEDGSSGGAEQQDQPAASDADEQQEQEQEQEPEAPEGPTLESLNEAFDRIVDQPVEEAELTPLIGEYERLLANTPDTERNVRLREHIRARIELLRIRADLQEDLRRLSRLEADAEQGAEVIEREVRGLSRRHEYLAVGRLTTSSLYDGRRLPLMYRLQSVGPGGSRTIAYIAPMEDVDLRGNLGRVVGVIGEEQIDENLRINIIRPSDIDPLASQRSPE